MTTYTIAIDENAGLLVACGPDGNKTNLQHEINEYLEERRRFLDCEPDSSQSQPAVSTVSGLTLSDDEPEDENRIVWRGHDLGWLTDANGTPYKYAIR